MRPAIKLSVLDLAPILEGYTPADTFQNSLALARATEAFGYNRYWLAEHHNMVSIASSATAVLIGFIAGGTAKIRVGSGGIMLPNHAPLVVAEQFGTLASLYPGRIDLGLGRAPGTDQLTARALHRHSTGADFYEDIRELQTYLSPENSRAPVRAIPGEGIDIPLWILGSSTDSAVLAAALGLPYAFASHFAPAYFYDALRIYRERFRPSGVLKQPYVMACVNVIAAETNDKAQRLATTFYRLAKGIVTNQRRPFQPPVDSMEGQWTPAEEAAVMQMMRFSFIGGPDKIGDSVRRFVAESKVDEIMGVSHIYEPHDRIGSYRLLAETIGK